jgi:hypothetical protein
MNISVSKSTTRQSPGFSYPLLIGSVHPKQNPVSVRGTYCFDAEYLIPIIRIQESGDGRNSIGRCGHCDGGALGVGEYVSLQG